MSRALVCAMPAAPSLLERRECSALLPLAPLWLPCCAHGQMLTFCFYRTPFIDMSNSLTQLVPLLDGSNYPRWAELMQAYLQQQEVWIIVDPPAGVAAPTLAQDGSNCNEVLGWAQMEAKAMGSIRLRLNAEVTRLVSDATTAKGLWEALKELYGTTSAMGAFSIYKATNNVQIPSNEHPGPAIAVTELGSMRPVMCY